MILFIFGFANETIIITILSLIAGAIAAIWRLITSRKKDNMDLGLSSTKLELVKQELTNSEITTIKDLKSNLIVVVDELFECKKKHIEGLDRIIEQDRTIEDQDLQIRTLSKEIDLLINKIHPLEVELLTLRKEQIKDVDGEH